MKKALINLTAVFAAAAMCLCTACGGGDSEEYTVDTFKGVVSEQSYKTKDTAVQAFIAEEVGGENLEAVFIEYIKEADLTQAEIAELNVEQKVDSAEKGKAVYSVSDKAKTSASAKEGGEEENRGEQRLYVLSVEGEYRYYTPAPQTEENITRSYFEDVLSFSKYVNCTIKAQAEIGSSVEAKSDQFGMSTVSKAFSDGYIKITENAIVSYGIMKGTYTMNGVEQEETIESYSYTVNTEQGVRVNVYSNGKDSYSLSVNGEENEGMVFISYLGYNVSEHIYYVKTAKGFALRGDMMEKYIKENITEDDEINEFTVDKDTIIDYYVKDGRLSKVDGNVKYFIDMKDGRGTVKMNWTNISKSEFCDYGTTVAEIPDEVVQFLAGEGYTVKA